MTSKLFISLVLGFLLVSGCSTASNASSSQAINNSTISSTSDVASSANEKNATNAVQKTDEPAEHECKICDFDYAGYKGDLKKEEVEGLLLALNDEYLAGAIYEQVNKDFDNPRPFVNIVQAEARHAERLKTLFATYKIPVPENPWTGNAPKFSSVAEACKAGVDAEIVNKKLYDKLFKSTSREDILTVYRALQRASEQNHLPAFERCGNGGGGHGRGNGGGMRRGNF